MIEVRGLRKSFGSARAVEEISFEAPDGAITGLLGPNGAGKTTTLRMIAGLLAPDAGTARVDGAPAGGRTGSLSVLPESFGLYGRLTGRENVAYYGRLHGLRGTALAAAVEATIGALGLAPVAGRRAEGYSQGERTKTALARVLVHGPRNLILDEPTRGLDVMSTRAIRDLLRRLRDEGRCILFSSHVMPEVEALCDRAILIARGRVAASGTPAELRRLAGSRELEEAFVHLVGAPEGS